MGIADQARKKAKDFAYEVHAGRDPMGEKQARRRALTVGELLDAYLASEAFASKAESTRAVDRGRIERHLRPLLGKHIADTLTAEDVKRAHKAIAEGKTAARVKTRLRGLARVTGGEGTANKAVLALSAAYKWAIEEKLVKSNPVTGMKGVWKTGERNTVLEDAKDYSRLFATLQQMQDQKRIRITLPPKAHKAGHKTGKPRIIALPAEAQAIIARQPEGEPDTYVFRPAKGEGPLALGKAWAMVRAEAKLPPDLGLHGLRHSIGTHLAMAGASAVELMETLGHKQITTTLRYIHFAERARSTLAERAASVALAGLKGQMGKAGVSKLQGKKGKTAA